MRLEIWRVLFSSYLMTFCASFFASIFGHFWVRFWCHVGGLLGAQIGHFGHHFFDVLIVTGAPIETLPFKDVNYWDELNEIVTWSKSNVFRRLGICWGSQVFLKNFYNVEKHILKNKLFGVYDHQLLENNDRLLQGFTNRFPMPVSRFTETRRQDLIDEDLEVLAESTLSGVGMVRSRSTKDLYILNHLEYDAETLKDEYLSLIHISEPTRPY